MVNLPAPLLTLRRCSAGDETAMRELDGEEAERWRSSREALQALELSEEEAEKVLKRAFGWATQIWWRDSKVCEVPAQGQVEAVIQFLDSVGVRGPDATKMIKRFPEMCACDVEEQLRENMAKLERDWKIKGPTAANVIKRQPQVLGYVIDCQGNCEGQCNRCWVRL
ncbi:hypothetical protein WJX81_001764 [Elliptochloris bilobata]|uniref:Uncharacterized protein n=1 Tax=Elliptochloris bilobata TaxID=381761 RepID=A0AAW1QVW6_9CHLO